VRGSQDSVKNQIAEHSAVWGTPFSALLFIAGLIVLDIAFYQLESLEETSRAS